MKKDLLKKAFLKTIPVMAGYVVLGTGFGILMNVNGFSIWWAVAMSLFVYAGSMQYVGVSLLVSHASLLSVALTTLMVNARHLFYGISMIQKYKGAGKRKPYLMHALTDETYSLVVSENTEGMNDPFAYYFLVSLFNQMYWLIGTVLGCFIGTVIPFSVAGIDFSMTALFVTVFVEQWVSTKEHRPALTGIGVSALCLLIFGADNFLIPAMLGITAVLMFLRPYMKEGVEHE